MQRRLTKKIYHKSIKNIMIKHNSTTIKISNFISYLKIEDNFKEFISKKKKLNNILKQINKKNSHPLYFPEDKPQGQEIW